MKFTKYAVMAAGCALLASCSSDDPIANSNASESSALNGETGYVTINLNLPTVSAVSRATEFDEGTAAESDVTNGYVFVFSQANGETDEAKATFVCAAPLTDFNFSAVKPGAVTSTSTSIAQLTNVTDKPSGITYKALVMLNVNPSFAQGIQDNTTFAQFRDLKLTSMTYEFNGNKYFTMSNAPLLEGAATEPVTLTTIDASKIKASAAEAAKAGSATNVYVQRGVAKVKLLGSASYKPTIDTYKNDNVEIKGWLLDIVSKESFPIQRTDGLKATYDLIWKVERFFEAASPRRVHWGKDPSYTGITMNNADNYFNRDTVNYVSFAPTGDNVLYALENTFDINNQKDYQTTRVGIKAIYSPAAVSGLTDKTFFKFNDKKELYNVNSVRVAIKAAVFKALEKKYGEEAITVEFKDSAKKAGYHSVNDFTISYNDGKGSKTLTDAQLVAVAKEFGGNSKNAEILATYENGISYYFARIKHFGELWTPWENGDPTYNGDNKSYLGRYGIVRNNVYEVSIRSISEPGSPVVPKPENIPDDVTKYYIQVSINILPWAKRSQNVDL